MSVLDELRHTKAERTTRLRIVAIGADLIPRSERADPHFAGLDDWQLVSRALNDDVRRVGMARLTMTADNIPAHMRTRAEGIGRELAKAGLIELGRWATDVQLAYARVPHLSEATQVAMFHAWTLAVRALTESEDVA